MAFSRGGDLKNHCFLQDPFHRRIPQPAPLLRGCSFNFVNMLFPACINCLQKCYYVPYSLLFISNIFLWNQILILHCAFLYEMRGFCGSGAPSSAVSAECSPCLLTVSSPAFMGFSFFFVSTDLLPLALDLIPISSAMMGFCLRTHFGLMSIEHPWGPNSQALPDVATQRQWSLGRGEYCSQVDLCSLQGTPAPFSGE